MKVEWSPEIKIGGTVIKGKLQTNTIGEIWAYPKVCSACFGTVMVDHKFSEFEFGKYGWTILPFTHFCDVSL